MFSQRTSKSLSFKPKDLLLVNDQCSYMCKHLFYLWGGPVRLTVLALLVCYLILTRRIQLDSCLYSLLSQLRQVRHLKIFCFWESSQITAKAKDTQNWGQTHFLKTKLIPFNHHHTHSFMISLLVTVIITTSTLVTILAKTCCRHAFQLSCSLKCHAVKHHSPRW